MDPLAQTVTDLAVTDTNVDHQSLVKYSREIPEQARSFLLEYDRLHEACTDAIAAGEMTRAANIKQSMDSLFDRLQTEMNKDEDKPSHRQLILRLQKLQEMQEQSLESNQLLQTQVIRMQQQI